MYRSNYTEIKVVKVFIYIRDKKIKSNMSNVKFLYQAINEISNH